MKKLFDGAGRVALAFMVLTIGILVVFVICKILIVGASTVEAWIYQVFELLKSNVVLVIVFAVLLMIGGAIAEFFRKEK